MSPTMQLPTLDRLGAKVDPDLSASAIARGWFQQFSKAVETIDVASVVKLFLPDGFWKDILALTWDFRTIHGQSDIEALLTARLPEIHLFALQLAEDQFRAPQLTTIFPDLAFLQFCFDFETKLGKGTGICRLAPTANDGWKAYTMFTCLDSLKGFLPTTGPLRDHSTPNRGTWEENRRREKEFRDRAPSVLIIGAGHIGLETAARLKHLGVPTLVVEKNIRVGDSWRNRYKSLCLHDPVWYNTTPIMPFPSSWPVYAPAPKIADWLESYAHTLELDVWTSSKVQKATWNDNTKMWRVEIITTGNQEPRFFDVKHLVFATGFSGSVPNVPDFPKKDIFKGQAFHSSAYTSSGKDFVGKKAVIIGACTSSHDIAQDFYNHGVDVTMYQRSSTYVISATGVSTILGELYNEVLPTDLADHFNTSLPFPVVKKMMQRVAPHLAHVIDKDIIEGLEKAGFKTNLGIDDSGILEMVYEKGGGYYIDTGTSQHIIDGHIKIKNGSAISEFTERGLKFADGSELEADVIIFATGYGDTREVVKSICGPEVSSKLGPIWGMDEEKEIRNVWRKCGMQGLWFGMGNFAHGRFHSTHLALQIKAMEEGLVPA